MTVQELKENHNWNIPTTCPNCGKELILDGKKLKCSNPYCFSYLSGRIAKWVKTLDIKEIGEATIKDLIENGVTELQGLYIDDFYYIRTLQSKEGYGEKSVNKIIDELKAHLEVSLVQFFTGLNIDGISEKILEKTFACHNIKTVSDVLSCKSFVCDGVGEILSDRIINGLSMLCNDISDMMNFIIIKTVEDKEMNDGVLNGKSFCFTGEASLPRKELQKLVEDNGGVNLSSVSKKLDYLVLADVNSKSTKTQKAKSLGVTLLSEEDFFKMVGIR